ncbi:hypothetical protein [Cellulomonas triticagri]|uniref:hypothetical protein n=1 Tax=Cellulomonas triticagri TaxID=2483352 RepID=UPI0018F5009A|nr:hypothetical protein [Cellulomonas triticagri]
MAVDQQAPSRRHDGLRRGVPAPRFASFERWAEHDSALAWDLYVWNRDLSAAFFADVAVLEIALRTGMHDAASAAWGNRWWADPDVRLDDRSSAQLAAAWSQLPPAVRRSPSGDDVPDRLVAQCTFGFWTNLLDTGGHTGVPPRRTRVDYEALWHGAFRQAFPGGRLQARAERERASGRDLAGAEDEIAFTRAWVHGVCREVNALRNRVAHHEPLVGGVPLPGRGRRMSPQDAHRSCLLLAAMLDRDLAEWLASASRVPPLLAARPGAPS